MYSYEEELSHPTPFVASNVNVSQIKLTKTATSFKMLRYIR